MFVTCIAETERKRTVGLSVLPAFRVREVHIITQDEAEQLVVPRRILDKISIGDAVYWVPTYPGAILIVH